MPLPAMLKCRVRKRGEESRRPESIFLKSQVIDGKSSQSSPQNACLNKQVNKQYSLNLMSR